MKRLELSIFNDKALREKKPVFNLYAEKDTDKEFANVLDNESLIKNIIKSNPEKGFELVFKKYYKPLCNHAIRYVYSKEIAEDIVSEIFANVWRKKLFETITGSYRAYLYQALRNNIYNYLKNEFAKKPDFLNNKDEEGLFECDTPQKILLFDELNNKIGESINSFSPQCQKVFLMSRVEGKKNREIAEELDIKLKTVEAHMMKALAILKNSLSAYLK
ncbi:RNA polymerase sigma-70 factor [Parasediminibacterium sp. JCM 36343]|uniref:RNA polymerase sigma-70 factor n=1 Tax=Parasediminibacterium sp. JCM 36343 TaxID=3374279 RepID=UPI00397DB52F